MHAYVAVRQVALVDEWGNVVERSDVAVTLFVADVCHIMHENTHEHVHTWCTSL